MSLVVFYFELALLRQSAVLCAHLAWMPFIAGHIVYKRPELFSHPLRFRLSEMGAASCRVAVGWLSRH